MTADITSKRTIFLGYVGIVMLLIIAWAPGLVTRDLWHVDEIRYVEVARQMDTYGHTLVPRLNGEVYREKPPLFFWATLGVAKIGLPYDIAGRVVAGLFLIVATLACGHLGLLLTSDSRLGLASALVFATFSFTIDRGQRAFIDPVFTSLVLCGTVALVRATLAKPLVERVLAVVLASLAMGLACLSKGVLGVLLPGFGGFVVALVLGGARGVPVVAFGAAGIAGLGVFLVWLRAAALEVGPSYWDDLLYSQTFGRTTGIEAPHAEPWHFYFGDLPPALLPWLILLPGAVVLLRRDLADAGRGKAARGALAAAAWAMGGLVIFSAMSAKRSGYVFPLFPPIAVVIAYGLSAFADAPMSREARFVRVPLAAVADALTIAGVLLAGAPLLAPVATGFLGAKQRDAARAIVDQLPPTTIVVGLLAGAMLIALARKTRRSRDPLAPIIGLASAIAVASAVANVTIVPALNATRSPRAFAMDVLATPAAHERIVILGADLAARINYFTKAEHYDVVQSDTLSAATAEPDRVWLIARDREWARVPEGVRTRFDVVVEREVGGRGFLLLHEK